MTKILNGWRGLAILISVILVPELICANLLLKEIGSFLWVTFHFITTPIYCLVHIVIALINISRFKISTDSAFNVISIGIALGFIYISVTGNIGWVKILQISFQ